MEGVVAVSIPYFSLVHIAVVFTRVTGALLFAPIWGYPGLPGYLKVILLFTTSLIIAAVAPSGDASYSHPEVILPTEFLIGLLLGMGFRIAFAGLHFGGQLVGYYLGFSMAETIDPGTANKSTLMSSFLVLAGYAILLATNQHHTILRAIGESYRIFPIGAVVQSSQWFDRLFQAAAQMFIIGWRIALPVFAVTLIAEIAVGVIARMEPQVNTMVVTIPLKLCVGLLAFGASLVFLPRVLNAAVDLMVLGR